MQTMAGALRQKSLCTQNSMEFEKGRYGKMKRIKYVVLTLENGETRMISTKTTAENYMRSLIADLSPTLPAKVTGWEVIA